MIRGQGVALRVLTPLSVERAALAGARRQGPVQVIRTGAGPARSRLAAERLVAFGPAGPVAVLGVGGALVEGLVPGDLVVADAVLGPGEAGAGAPARVELPAAAVVAAALRRDGLRVEVGAIASGEAVVTGPERARQAQRGAVLADTESWWLARAGQPVAVVRAVVDGPGRELLSFGTGSAGVRALGSLRRALPGLLYWAEAVRPRQVILAGPRASCAGVDRAVEIVERALARYGAPVYVRRQIVHNAHVVSRLEGLGAVFVQEVEEAPPGATVVLAAHGVSPEVRDGALRRAGRVIDATCPLVAKVHAEARRFSRQGRRVLLIGHAGHEEVQGTIGEVPGTVVLGSAADLDALDWDPSTEIGLLSQTTLARDEVAELTAAVRRRFPSTAEPAASDVCYATQNRQEAVRAVAGRADAVLVVGSANSSNGNRLVEVARRSGCEARLVEDENDLDAGWLRPAGTVGITAAASTPEALVERVVRGLAGLGPTEVSELRVVEEDTRFQLPLEVR